MPEHIFIVLMLPHVDVRFVSDLYMCSLSILKVYMCLCTTEAQPCVRHFQIKKKLYSIAVYYDHWIWVT